MARQQLQQSDYEALKRLEQDREIIEVLSPYGDRRRTRYSIADSNWELSVKSFLRLLRVGAIEHVGDQRYAITERGRTLLATKKTTPLEALDQLEGFSELPSPRKRVFLAHFTRELNAASSGGKILDNEKVRLIALAVLQAVRAGVPLNVRKNGRDERPRAEQEVQPTIVKSNSTGRRNQFRDAGSLRVKRKVRHRS